ncbi:MAG TPA: FISUMP domain-containing protein [Flavobacteriales bacterium]|nr:FISUMP domain-containing protein [Flavobacteriales bacterium]
MERRILLLEFLILLSGLHLSAQTLKNIHRHNQPVLHIPTHLIDRVETAEINGERVLKVIQLNGYVSQIPVSQIDSITHSEGQAVDPAQLGNLRTASVMGVVSGPTGAPEMNAIVRSPYGGEETRTDPNGVFFLNNILVYDKLGYITITKPGFHQGSRSFLPLENGSNRVNVQLLPMTMSGSFSASTGGTVTSGLLQLSFPANAIQLNGQPYTGTVKVYAKSLDPTSNSMFDQMPGELLGGMNDSLRLLRSFGMASIELRDANMNELQLANGLTANLTFSIPTALQAEAPQTIDWWSFDEELGIWYYEGEAQKQGTQYVGLASHFSWWNCDRPQDFNDFHGTINSVGGTPVSDAQVNVVTLNLGTGITYTNAEGVFTGRVPKNQILTLNIYLTCETTNDWYLVYTESFSSATEPIVGQYEPASLDGRFPITGTVTNCVGQPVVSGYVKMGPQVFLTNESGHFSIQTCAVGEYFIRGYDTSTPDTIKASVIDTVQVGMQGMDAGLLQACTEIYVSVSDFDGNVYPTVLIGNQQWMAENLRSTHYANGEAIPNVPDHTAWSILSTGAWCYYNNSAANELVYGKLYNWYTVTDSRNVCPTGWHVPTDEEWAGLTDYLGGDSVAGGKMKTISGWIGSNNSATNESGFSGLPGGYRSDGYDNFSAVGSNSYSWSTSEDGPYSAWSLFLYNAYGNAYRNSYSKRDGFSVRCLKD